MELDDEEERVSHSEDTEDQSEHENSEEDKLSDKLSINYGPEMYLILNEEEQKEIAKRNSEMRDRVKSLRKSKELTKTELPGSYINISTKKGQLKSQENSKGKKALRDILDLTHLHKQLKFKKIPFIVLLDIELNRLLEWLVPSDEEKEAKRKVLLQLQIVVNSLFPEAKLRPFGSCVTGLSLPGADIDVCIEYEGDQICVLNMIMYTLNRLGLIHSFECIYNANVPIVKLVDKRSGVRIDLSAYNESAVKTTNFIFDMCVKYKYMQPLILLIKLYLQSRNLGNTYFGGVGSYLLYCMVLSFLQLHDSTSDRISDDTNTLATLFVDFFYYWGFIRNYNKFTTSVRGFGHVYPRNLRKGSSDHMFSCENPIDNSLDLGASSFNMHSVVSSFQNAFMVLKTIESNMDNWFPNKNVSFEMNFSTILESLYDNTHPIFQNRNASKVDHLRNGFFLGSSKNLHSDIESVLNQLKNSYTMKSNTFNAQRELMESLSSYKDADSGSEVPFYLIAEAVGKQGV